MSSSDQQSSPPKLNRHSPALSSMMKIVDKALAAVFRLLWSPALALSPDDSKEVRFIKEEENPNWARELARAIRRSQRPVRNLWLLLCPYPCQFTLQPLYPSLDFVQNPELACDLHMDDHDFHVYPPFRARDTPLRSLYRLHAWICSGYWDMLLYETQYFYGQHGEEWKLENLPDPCDPDPLRYAVLAGLVEVMVFSFNERLETGLPRMLEGLSTIYRNVMRMEGRTLEGYEERAPEWVAKVPAVEGPPVELVLGIVRDGGGDGPFGRRNVLLGGEGNMFWC